MYRPIAHLDDALYKFTQLLTYLNDNTRRKLAVVITEFWQWSWPMARKNSEFCAQQYALLPGLLSYWTTLHLECRCPL